MNNFSFTGNLGRDVEVKYTAGGMCIANFSVPVKSGFGDKEKTSWIRCAIIGKRAEGGLMQYLKKGQLVGITGELSVNVYQNQDGAEKTSVEVFVRDIDLLGSKNQSQPAADNFSQAPAQPMGDFDDDLAF